MNVDDILRDLPGMETERLVLRKLRMEDAEDMFEYGQDQEIAFRGLWPPLQSLEESQADLADAMEGYAAGSEISWAIEHRADRKMIGRIGLGPYSRMNHRAEIGYALNRNYWGQGLATEAVSGVLGFAFGEMGLNRVQAIVLPDNIGSMRVLEKAGMRREGLLRGYQFVLGKYWDVYMYGVLRSDWDTGG
ncbi:MAG: GNAT family N-acetyltransferase [Chloroflexota bacterium]|nr:GNAT family N-acetyltransferase [Chloroflexota bacterium]MDQ5867273.1 GNAT family N-acetyltransferase [Chloroflexota bacterium]